MTVSITMSGESGGLPLEEVQDVGSITPDEDSGVQELYIRHDAENFPITDCGFYVVRYAGTGYTGSDPDADYAELLQWGDDSGPVSHSGGGLYLNQSHSTSFPTSDWYCFRSGYGADPNNAIQLLAAAINNPGVGSAVDGEIPVQGEAHVQWRLDIPLTVSAAGTRFVQLIMAFSYTS